MTIETKRDIAKRVIFVTLVSIVGSLLITFSVFHPQSIDDALTALIPAILTPAIVAPLVTTRLGIMQMRLHEQSQELHRLACEDMLTGLLNRRAFWNAASDRLALARRSKLRYSFILIDIDHFKKINDRHGHRVGDQALTSVAETLRRSVRDIDVLGRVGGEEFAVFLFDTGLHKALDVAERIRAAVAAERIACGEATIAVTVSLGVAERPWAKALDGIYHAADEALYEAKNTGRNRVAVAAAAAGPAIAAEVA